MWYDNRKLQLFSGRYLQILLYNIWKLQNIKSTELLALDRQYTDSITLPTVTWYRTWRIKFKLCILMHSAHISRCPKYLTDVLKPAANYLRPGLNSSSTTNNYILPRLQSRLSERAFSYAWPLAWNSLSADLQNIPDTSTFKKRLKTYLFNSVF